MLSQTNSKTHNSTFLKKLQQILENPTLQQTIRWNSKGTTINVTCIKRLQEQVLPLYFRHSKYTSFVRQLNIYGFSKCKSEKGVAASFGHPIYVRGFQEFGRIMKRGRKEEGRRGKGKGEGKGEDVVGNGGEMYHLENNTGQLVSADNNKNQIMEQQHITEKYSQIQQKQSTHQLLSQPLSYPQSPNQQPSVTQLIEQLDAKIQEFSYDLDILKSIEIESLLKDNRYTMIRPFYQDRRTYEIQNDNSSLEEINLAMWEYHEGPFSGILNSQRMEFIL